MKIRYIFSVLAFTLLISACNNDEWVFPDYRFNSAYFPLQTPVRTLILGQYDQGINENDNNHRFEMGLTMSGVYENEADRKVYFEIDNSLLNNVTNVQVLPEEFFNIEVESPVTIPAGSTKGRIPVQLTEAFFLDPMSFAPVNEVNYVIPLKITRVENLDSILSGVSAAENPDPVNPADWDVLPKDYMLYGIKFMNKYHGNYLRRGLDVVTDSNGDVAQNFYRKEYVEEDEVVMVTTSGYNSVILENIVRRGEASSPGSMTMELTFDESDNGTISSVEGDPYNINGTSTFVDDGDEWGGKVRDVIYLDYSYSDLDNNETHAVKDTLVIRDRAAVFEQFTPELQ